MKINDVINSHQYVCFVGEYDIRTIDLGNEEPEFDNIVYQKTVEFKDLEKIDKIAYDFIKSNGADDADNDEVHIWNADGGIIYVPEFWQ